MQRHTVDGLTVTIVRPAKEGDPGFDPQKDPQTVVANEDGEERCVVSSTIRTIAEAD